MISSRSRAMDETSHVKAKGMKVKLSSIERVPSSMSTMRAPTPGSKSRSAPKLKEPRLKPLSTSQKSLKSPSLHTPHHSSRKSSARAIQKWGSQRAMNQLQSSGNLNLNMARPKTTAIPVRMARHKTYSFLDERPKTGLMLTAPSSLDGGASMADTINSADDAEVFMKRDLTKIFDKKICGHIFSSSSNKTEHLQGMLYKSRLQQYSRDPPGSNTERSNLNKTVSSVVSAVEDDDEDTVQGSVGAEGQGEDAAMGEGGLGPRRQHSLSETESESDDEAGERFTHAQRMAHTLNNWCRTRENMNHMIKEQGVQVLVALSSKGQDDFNIMKYCVSAFHRLSRVAKHRKALLEGDAVNALLTLSYGCIQFRSGMVARTCAAALVNLTLHKGGEHTLACDGGSFALINNLMPLNEAKLAPICLQGLFNLSCVKADYEGIDKVLRSLLSVTQSERIDSKEIVAKGLCNCSRVFKLRLKMLDEGTVRVLTNILCPNRKNLQEEPRPLKAETKYAALVTLYRMATARACRADMISKGVMKVLKEISERETAARLLYCVAATLQNLAQDSNSKLRMVKEGALLVVSNVVEKAAFLQSDSTGEIYRLLSSTLHHLSKNHYCVLPMVDPTVRDGRNSMVLGMDKSKGAIPCLVDLCTRGDHVARANCLYTFCNLLLEPKAHAYMLSTNAMKILLELIDNYDNEDAEFLLVLSYALYHIAKIKSSHEKIMELGIVHTLVRFCNEDSSEHVQEECGSALCLLSYQPPEDEQQTVADRTAVGTDLDRASEAATSPRVGLPAAPMSRNLSLSNHDGPLEMSGHQGGKLSTTPSIDKVRHVVESGAVEALVSLLSQYPEPSRQVALQCTVCLSILAHNQQHTASFLHESTIMAVAEASLRESSELQTIQASCSFLASLSFDAAARAVLMQLQILDILLKLASMDDKKIQRHCATCFCNLSVEEEHRGLMVAKGVVPRLSEISNSYNEDTQEDCARCLCNLSCHEPTIQVMVKQGAVQALMMIVMVRSVQEVTKHLCAKALLNLIDDNTMEFMLTEGVVQAFAELSASQQDEDTLDICAKALSMFSCFPAGRRKLTERKRTMEGLFALTNSSSVDTKVNCCKAVCNLIIFNESSERSAVNGALGVLKILATLPIRDLRIRVPYAMAVLVENDAARIRMTKEDTVSILIYLTRSDDREVILAAVRALTCFAYHKTMRKPLVRAGACSALAQIILSLDRSEDLVPSLREDLARAMCYMSVPNANRRVMCNQAGVVATVVLCRRSTQLAIVEALSALTLQYLSWSQRSQETLITEGGVQLLVEIIFRNRADHDSNGTVSVGDELELAHDCITVCANISSQERFRQHLIDLRVVEAMHLVVSAGDAEEKETVRHIIRLMWYLAQTKELRNEIINQGGTQVLVALGTSQMANEAVKQMIAKTLCFLSKSRSNRPVMVKEGAMNCLLQLAEEENTVTRRMCAVTLTNLSGYAKLEGSTLWSQLKLYSDHGKSPASVHHHHHKHHKLSAKVRKAKDALRNMILAGMFVTSAEKRAPGVFHNSYTSAADANIDILPPTSGDELEVYRNQERKLSHIYTPSQDSIASLPSFDALYSFDKAVFVRSKASVLIEKADSEMVVQAAEMMGIDEPNITVGPLRDIPRHQSFYGGLIYEAAVTHSVVHIRMDAGVAMTSVTCELPVPPMSLISGKRADKNPGEDDDWGTIRESIVLDFPKLMEVPDIEVHTATSTAEEEEEEQEEESMVFQPLREESFASSASSYTNDFTNDMSSHERSPPKKTAFGTPNIGQALYQAMQKHKSDQWSHSHTTDDSKHNDTNSNLSSQRSNDSDFFRRGANHSSGRFPTPTTKKHKGQSEKNKGHGEKSLEPSPSTRSRNRLKKGHNKGSRQQF